jgi:hypothetical protein
MEREIIVLDSQRLSMIKTCAYKFDLVFNRNFVPVNKALPLERGSSIHIMLDTYYTLKRFQRRWGLTSPDNPRRAHNLIDIIKICVRVLEHRAISMSLSIEEVDDAIRVFNEYVEFYQDEPHETLAVEQVGSRILHENEERVIIYETKIDWISRLPQVPVLPWDHKTYTRRGPTSSLVDQFPGYCWMLGVNNIGINKIGFQTTIAPKDKFMRILLSYNQSYLDGWVQETADWVDYMRACYKNNQWLRNTTSCDKWDGCIFQEVCLTQPDLRDWKARSLFDKTEQPWDIGAAL